MSSIDTHAAAPRDFFAALWQPLIEHGPSICRGSWWLEVRWWEDAAVRKRPDYLFSRSLEKFLVRAFDEAGIDGTPGPQGGRNGVFFGPHARTKLPTTGTSTDADVEFATAIFLDFDAKDFGGSKEATLAHAQQAMSDHNVPAPSAVISSGGGYHFYWFLDSVWQFADPVEYAEVVRGFAKDLGADLAVHNPSRVMRFPGSVHLKDPANPKLVRIQEFNPSRRYPLDEFLPHKKPLPVQRVSGKSIKFDTNYTPPDSIHEYGLPRALIRAIETGFWPEYCLNSENNVDRSLRDWHYCRALLEAGNSHSAIRAFFATVQTIGDKYKAEGDRYLARTIAAAESFLGERAEDAQEDVGATTARPSASGTQETEKSPEDRGATAGQAESGPTAPRTAPTIGRDAGMVFHSLSELRANPPPKPPQIIEDCIIIEGTLAMLSGPPKAFKTWLIDSIALAVAGGFPWLGKFLVPAPRTVAVISLEGGLHMTYERLSDMAEALKLGDEAVSRVHIWNPQSQIPNLTSPQSVTEIAARIADLNADLLIIDPLIEAHHADENSSKEMAEVVRGLREIADAAGAAVLLCHHTRKPAEKGGRPDPNEARGSGVLYGAVSSAMAVSLQRVEWCELGYDGVQLAFSLRHAPAPEDLWVCLDKTKVLRIGSEIAKKTGAERAEARADVMAEHAERVRGLIGLNPGITKKELKGRLKWSPSMLKRAIDDLAGQGQVEGRTREGSGRTKFYYLKDGSGCGEN